MVCAIQCPVSYSDIVNEVRGGAGRGGTQPEIIL
jgi:hypothetical protein